MEHDLARRELFVVVAFRNVEIQWTPLNIANPLAEAGCSFTSEVEGEEYRVAERGSEYIG